MNEKEKFTDRDELISYIKKNWSRYSNGRYQELVDMSEGFSYNAIRWMVRNIRDSINEKVENENLNIKEDKRGDKEITGFARTVEELLKLANVDTDIWYVDDHEIEQGYWDTASKWRDQDLKWEVEKNEKGEKQQFMTGHAKRKNEWVKTRNEKYRIKVKLKRKVPIQDIDTFKKNLMDELKELSPIVPLYEYTRPKNGDKYALSINIFDLHLGLLVWSPETGGMDWDIKLAEHGFNEAFEDILNKAIRAAGGKEYIDQILIPIGNDFFNSDKDMPFSTTTKGTPQQEDSRWQKIFKIGRELLIKNINKAATIAPVKIKVVPGNHDFQKSFYLGDALYCYYLNNENVIVDNGPKPQKYWHYGNTLIGLTHGSPHKEGKRLDTIMQFEVPELWYKTIFHEWWMGDIHHKKTKEIVNEDKQGLFFRWARTLMPASAWETEQGYKSMKGSEGYLVHFEKGPEFEIRHNKIVEQSRKEII